MLGRLFSANSAATSPNGTRPSTAATHETEDIYTKNLLYPDTNPSSFHSGYSFLQTGSSGSSDNIDIEANRDIRVIIAQDGSSSETKAVLYDTRPHNQHFATGLPSDDGPLSPGLGGTYGRSRRRGPSQFHTPASGAHPTQNASGSIALEDELKVLTDCMFGSAPLAYKGPSTKVHMLPTVEERKTQPTTAPSSRRGSVRNVLPTPYGSQPNATTIPAIKERRKSVLITRLFSVVMPASPVNPTPNVSFSSVGSGARDQHEPTPSSSVGSNHGFPFPKMGGANPSASTAAKLIKPPKTSMYAVGLIVSLPNSPPLGSSCLSISSPTNRCCYHQGPFNFLDQDLHHHEYCCPTPPFDEDCQPTPADSLRTDSIFDESLPTSLTDDRMDLVTKHWDVITRALSDLQRVAEERILEHLTMATIPSFHQPQNGFKYRKRIELQHAALISDEIVRKEVERLRWRVVTGIKVPRVITGQGRWAIWRDEAKWANTRFGGRDMHFFFLTLLTAFLGHHTEWLDVLGPAMHRRKHQQQQNAQGINEDCPIPTRTVILCNDKISARRLIYLLSAFFPSKSLPAWESMPPPSRTSSINYLSQSPPISAGFGPSSSSGSKKGSLRKKAKKKPSKLSMVTGDDDEISGWDIPVTTVSGNSSAAGSVLQLPIVNETARRPSNTLTTMPSSATILANAPVSPHKHNGRPGSSGSVASINLMNTLRRNGSANTSADSGSGWGSFLSFWSNPKTGSTAASETSTYPDEPANCMPAKNTNLNHSEEESADVNELYFVEDDLQHHYNSQIHTLSPPNFPPHHHRIQNLPPLSESPLRMSVDENDGIVDVDIPIPATGFSTNAFTSPISSPSSGGWAMSLPSFESVGNGIIAPSFHGVSSGILLPFWVTDTEDNSLNVAGWMEDEKFHPDFTLQAVKPYPEIEAEIKKAMRLEPTPSQAIGTTPGAESEHGPNRWVEVCSTLVVDTEKMKIKSLKLRRKISPTAPNSGDRHPHMQSSPVLHDEEKEVIDEEVVCDVDDVLATAIERAIGVASFGKSGLRHEEERPGEGCKDMVLGALEGLVRAVAVDRRGVVGNVLTEGVAKWLNGVEEGF
ncbi:hypothetical protein RUND412_011002 [Rhizina undulata]